MCTKHTYHNVLLVLKQDLIWNLSGTDLGLLSVFLNYYDFIISFIFHQTTECALLSQKPLRPFPFVFKSFFGGHNWRRKGWKTRWNEYNTRVWGRVTKATCVCGNIRRSGKRLLTCNKVQVTCNLPTKVTSLWWCFARLHLIKFAEIIKSNISPEVLESFTLCFLIKLLIQVIKHHIYRGAPK